MEDSDQKVDLICVRVHMCKCPEKMEEDAELPLTQQSTIVIMFFGEKASLFLDVS